jgi:hypothetical protein
MNKFLFSLVLLVSSAFGQVSATASSQLLFKDSGTLRPTGEIVTSPVIPPAPAYNPATGEGIFDKENLYNDVYGYFPRLRWEDPEFHDKLTWIGEQVPFKITSFYSIVNSAKESTIRTSTWFRVEVGGSGGDFDVLNVVRNPDLLVYAFKRLANPNSEVPQIKLYPGFSVRWPGRLTPIGALWEPSPWPGRVLYREAGSAFAIGETWEDATGKYRKVNVQTKVGSGPFGQGAELTPAWEVIYRR